MTVTAPAIDDGFDDIEVPALPRLLSDLDVSGAAVSLAQHRATYAPPPAARRRTDLIDSVEKAGLRGRGGAAFPTAKKLRAVAAGRGRPTVVVNGAEGEPASAKDKLLLRRAPHLVLDGALLAAGAVRATEVVVCVDRTATRSFRAVQHALAERAAAGERTVPVRLAAVPHRYVAGEESALVHWLDGGPAKPTLNRVFETGVGGNPTLVDNVETLAHLAQIGRWGPAWFRQFGTEAEPGTFLVTVSGAVERPGVYEVPLGAPFADVMRATGAQPSRVPAVLVGGYFGTWLDGAALRRARLSNEYLRPLGSALGCGAIVVLPRDVCGLHETARILEWLAGESVGQCGSCVHGLAAIAGATAGVAHSRAGDDSIERLHRWAAQVEGRGGCRFPDGAVRLLRSALRVFADDVERHLRGEGCAARPSVLTLLARKDEPWR